MAPRAAEPAAEKLQAGTKFEALGGWQGAGWRFDLTFVVDVVDGEKAEGHSDWVLRAVPQQYEAEYGPKIGSSAVEKWKGTTSGRAIRVEGFEKEDKAEVIAEGKYQLVLLYEDDLYDDDSDDEEEIIERDGGHKRAQVAMGRVSGCFVKLVRLTEAEEDLEALFKLADADGDGGISKEETMKYLKSQGVELDDVALDMMWQLVDLDGNGTVDMEEFKLLRFVIRKLLDGMKMGHALRLLREIIADQQPEPEPEPEPEPAPEPAAEKLQAGTKFEALGGWQGAGWRFDLTFVVDVVDGEKAEGHSDWVLRAVPQQYEAEYGPKIGSSAVEKWKGTTSGRAIRVEGFEKEDKAEVIAEGKYQLVLLYEDDLYDDDSDDEEEIIERDGGHKRAQVAMGRVSGCFVKLVRLTDPEAEVEVEVEAAAAAAEAEAEAEAEPEVEAEPEAEPEVEAKAEPTSPLRQSGTVVRSTSEDADRRLQRKAQAKSTADYLRNAFAGLDADSLLSKCARPTTPTFASCISSIEACTTLTHSRTHARTRSLARSLNQSINQSLS